MKGSIKKVNKELQSIIKEKANRILEKTSKEQNNYINERQIIFSIMENIKNSNDITILENLIEMFDRIIKLENEKKKYEPIILELQKIVIEQTRNQDKSKTENKTNIFIIKDNSGKNYEFLLRENAKKYISDNKNNFNNTTSIEISINSNVDIEMLLNKLRDIK